MDGKDNINIPTVYTSLSVLRFTSTEHPFTSISEKDERKLGGKGKEKRKREEGRKGMMKGEGRERRGRREGRRKRGREGRKVGEGRERRGREGGSEGREWRE